MQRRDGRTQRVARLASLSPLSGAGFWVSVFPQANHLALCPIPWLICLRTWAAHPHLRQDGSRGEGCWKEQDPLWSEIIPWLLTPRSLLCIVSLSLYSDRVFASLFPCQDYSIEVFIRDRHWLFTLVCCCFHFREQTGGWLWISNLEPSYLLPQEMHRGGWLIGHFQLGAHLSPTSLSPCVSMGWLAKGQQFSDCLSARADCETKFWQKRYKRKP